MIHLLELIDGFLSDLRTCGQLKPSTQRAYRKDMVAAVAALPGAIEQITGACLTTYLAAAIAPSTVARRLAALRVLFGWALREGYIAGEPTLGLEAPRRTRKLPRPIRTSADRQAVEQGQRLEIVQRVLGHRDPRSTQGYARLAETQVRAALEAP